MWFPFSDTVVEMLSRSSCVLLYAAELDFKNDIARAHTGTGQLIINGHTFEGIGELGDVQPFTEQLESGSVAKCTLTLNGLDKSVVSNALKSKARGRQGRVYVVAMDEEGNYAADILFSGKMDAPQFSFDEPGEGGDSDGDGNTIQVTLIDRMADWQRKGTERWTDESHRARHGGDRFFYAVAQMADWPIYWGGKRDAPSFNYPR